MMRSSLLYKTVETFLSTKKSLCGSYLLKSLYYFFKELNSYFLNLKLNCESIFSYHLVT